MERLFGILQNRPNLFPHWQLLGVGLILLKVVIQLIIKLYIVRALRTVLRESQAEVPRFT